MVLGRFQIWVRQLPYFARRTAAWLLCWVLRLIVYGFVAAVGIYGTIALAVEPSDSAAKYRRQTDRGFLHKIFVDESGLLHKYVVYVPHQIDSVPNPPVLMFLNGIGENGDDGIRQISNNFGVNVWENRDYFPFIAVAPQCRTEGNWIAGSEDVKWALEILDTTIREFDADPERVYLTGVSAGGSAVWSVASAYPDRFAALAPMCGSGGANAQILIEAGVPIWNFYNERDGRKVVEFNTQIRSKLIEIGGSPLVTEYPVGGHDCWNRAYRTTALYRWLLEHRRSENQFARPFIYLPPHKLLQDWEASENSTWTADADNLIGRSNVLGNMVAGVSDREPSSAIVPGGGDEEEDFGRLVSTQLSNDFEFHGDVWMTAKLNCRIRLRDDNPATPEYEIAIVTPTLGSGGVSSFGGTVAKLEATGEPASEKPEKLPTEKFRMSLEPAAQHTLRVESWNDVRISVRNNCLSVRLNGWPALNVRLDTAEALAPPPKYRLILKAPSDGTAIRWRYIRTRSSVDAASLSTVSSQPSLLEKGKGDNAPQCETSESLVGDVGQILKRWSDHSSRPVAGRIVFQLVNRTRSASYGEILRPETASSSVETEAIRIAFDKEQIRLDGQAVPALCIGRSILPDTEVWEATNEFIDTLHGNKQLGDSGLGLNRNWIALVDNNSETHSWINGNAFPCFVKFRGGTAGTLGIHDSGRYGTLPVLWALIEAMRLSLKPQWVITESHHESASLQSPVTIRGRSCMSTKFLMHQIAGNIACEVQVDESRGNVIVGATFTGDPGVLLSRYDIDYDCDADGCWWPKTIGVVQFNGFGDPYDSIQLIRQSHSANSVTAADISLATLSEGSCVIDRTVGEQYQVTDDGSHRPMPLVEAVRMVFAEANTGVHAGSETGIMKSMLKTILTFVKWPWIMLVLPLAAFLWQVIRVVAAKRMQLANQDLHDADRVIG